ncbi:hypothetical protein GEMRC1_004874 [Eukaryota sp. GEM-RC1]
MIQLVYNVQNGKHEDTDFAFYARNLTDFFVIAITIVVVAVPEGLPLAVTISLAYSVRKMMKYHNLVRHLDACETIGSCTIICSDKTGTLTQNSMTVVQFWTGGDFYHTEDNFSVKENLQLLISESLALNSDAYLSDAGGLTKVIGSPTEGSLLVFLKKKFGIRYGSIREDIEKGLIVPFNSDSKMMVTCARSKVFENNWLCHVKGASESVLEKCGSYADAYNNIEPLSSSHKDKIHEIIREMASRGLRTMVVAYKPLNSNPQSEYDLSLDKLCLLGVFGIKDPPRPEVFDAIRVCGRAGVRVCMVTGDNLLTAKQIAAEIGILRNGIAIEGEVFRELSDAQMEEVLPRLEVLARSSPSDKHLLVKKYKEMGEVVSVTGDGTNDSLALKAADVGLAMGICGTSVAKEASDIIILNDSFGSIVSCISYGRCVYDNIQKFLQFQLTVNLTALALTFLSATTGRSLPMNAVQLLWVNLIMDSLAALALATELPTPELLERSPPKSSDGLISKHMVRNIAGQFCYQMFVLLYFMYFGHLNLGVEVESTYHYTFIFTTFILCQLFNEINCRRVERSDTFKDFFSNYLFVGVVIGSFVIQFFLVTFGGNFFNTEPLSFQHWALSALLGAGSIVVDRAVRQIDVKKRQIHCYYDFIDC